MNIIMLALLVLAIVIMVPTLIYLWIKWYYNELDRLVNYKYDTEVMYIVINSIATALLFGVCVCISWLILIHDKGRNYLIGQLFALISCSVIDIALIVSGICIADEVDEFKEYRNSLIYIIQFILIIPISICIVFNLIKYESSDPSNKKRESIAEQLNEDINDRYNI